MDSDRDRLLRAGRGDAVAFAATGAAVGGAHAFAVGRPALGAAAMTGVSCLIAAGLYGGLRESIRMQRQREDAAHDDDALNSLLAGGLVGFAMGGATGGAARAKSALLAGAVFAAAVHTGREWLNDWRRARGVAMRSRELIKEQGGEDEKASTGWELPAWLPIKRVD